MCSSGTYDYSFSRRLMFQRFGPNAGVSKRALQFREKRLSDKKRIAAEQTRWRVILKNERTCSRSKFRFKENHPGASRAWGGFDGIADRRRCDELDLVS